MQKSSISASVIKRLPRYYRFLGELMNKGVERISIVNGNASVPENTEIDLGAVAKGCAGDAAAKALKEQGVTSALLDLGGNIQNKAKARRDPLEIPDM